MNSNAKKIPRDLREMERKAKVLFEDKSIDGIDVRAFRKPHDGIVCLQLMATESTNRVTWGMNPNFDVSRFKNEMERISVVGQEFFSEFCRRFGKPE